MNDRVNTSLEEVRYNNFAILGIFREPLVIPLMSLESPRDH